jgi:hypothetical protein
MLIGKSVVVGVGIGWVCVGSGVIVEMGVAVGRAAAEGGGRVGAAGGGPPWSSTLSGATGAAAQPEAKSSNAERRRTRKRVCFIFPE